MGGAGHMVPTGETRPQDRVKPTIRQITSGQANDNGPAAPINKAPMVQCTYKQLGKPAKRYASTGYVPMAERNNEYRRANIGGEDPWEIAGICKGKWIALKEKSEANRVMSHGAANNMYLNMAPVGESAATKNWLPQENRRQDFGLAQTVLKNNEYAISINS